MNSFLLHSPVKNLEDTTIKHMPVLIYEPSHNTNERNKFIDNAIRVKDQPLMYTEECIAVGCPEDLW